MDYIIENMVNIITIIYYSFISIPLEMKDGRSRSAMCSMYARNYSHLFNLMQTNSSTTLMRDLSPSTNITSCLNGWNYDTSVFKSTVVTEVIFNFS